jgi:hypothetical protein
MDFAKFDMRGKAEEGRAFPILHPETLEPLSEGGKEARFIIRGSASASVQEAQRALLAQAAKGEQSEETPTFGWLHDSTMKSAIPLIIGFENVEVDGKALSVEDVPAFLNLVFPRVVKDPESGKFKIANKTFAMQALERSAELDALLGNV